MSRLRSLMMTMGGGGTPEEIFYKAADQLEDGNYHDMGIDRSLLPTGAQPCTLASWINIGDSTYGDNFFLLGWGDVPYEDKVFGIAQYRDWGGIFGACWGGVDVGDFSEYGREEWHHYAFTNDGEKVAFYADGNLIAEQAHVCHHGNSNASFGSFWSENGGASYKHTRIYNGCLTAAQIKALYDAEKNNL